MWTTFLPDLLIALIGATLTVGIAFATFKLNARRDETQALTALVGELNRRRALTGLAVVIPGAAERSDFHYATASVLSMRDEVRQARDRVRPGDATQKALSSMTRACNEYLEGAESDPNQYAVLLVELKDRLDTAVATLTKARRSVPHLVPGDGAFD